MSLNLSYFPLLWSCLRLMDLIYLLLVSRNTYMLCAKHFPVAPKMVRNVPRCLSKYRHIIVVSRKFHSWSSESSKDSFLGSCEISNWSTRDSFVEQHRRVQLKRKFMGRRRGVGKTRWKMAVRGACVYGVEFLIKLKLLIDSLSWPFRAFHVRYAFKTIRRYSNFTSFSPRVPL